MLKKVTQKKVTSSASVAVSAIGGGMLSNGLVNLAPSKTEKYKMILRGILAAAGIVGAASVKTKGKNSAELQSFFAGMSIAQALTLVKDWTKDMSFVNPSSEKVTDKFIAGVFGLGCGNCGDYNNNQYSFPALKMPSLDPNSARLRNYGIDDPEVVEIPSFR